VFFRGIGSPFHEGGSYFPKVFQRYGTNTSPDNLLKGLELCFRITTERLVLEDPAEEDLLNFRQVARDRDVMKYVLIWLEDDAQIAAFHRHAMDGSQRIDRMDYILAARHRKSGDFAGLVFLERVEEQASTGEVGCALLPAYWGNGFALEVLNGLLRFGFCDLALHRVFGKCDELNLASARVLEKGGLKYEGTLREHVWLRDHWRSTKYYGMLDREYSLMKEKSLSEQQTLSG
jgi:[ribosomal protein S5]-alanine N-acetyltransferase